MRIGQTQARPSTQVASRGHHAQIRLMPGQTRTAWEAVIATTLAPGDKVLVLGFAPLPLLWAGIAEHAGLRVEIMTAPTETTLSRHLGADRFGDIRAVFLAHDGATPLAPAAVRRALDSCFHDALLLIDASAVPGADLATCHADIVIADPQAGLARLAPRPAVASE
jgi:alanine-glyoxylate transaminase/serine-glyoxylate transaminase/serine-pyruvate transaminase